MPELWTRVMHSAHVKGDAKNGIVEKDYEVRP